MVWNYTSPKYRDVSYAVGEFIRTQPAPDKTNVNWTYRFALKKDRDPEVFRKSFLDSHVCGEDAHRFGKRTSVCRVAALNVGLPVIAPGAPEFGQPRNRGIIDIELDQAAMLNCVGRMSPSC